MIRERAWLCATASVLLAGATVIAPPPPLFVWNVSASSPRGLYLITPRSSPARGGMAVAHLPEPWRRLAANRHYLSSNVPVVKRVAAAAGDRVCAEGRGLLVNGRSVAVRLRRDPHGRPMPWWNGCLVLNKGSLLLLGERADSFDGRYFGPTLEADVIGQARLVWRA